MADETLKLKPLFIGTLYDVRQKVAEQLYLDERARDIKAGIEVWPFADHAPEVCQPFEDRAEALITIVLEATGWPC